MTCGFYGLNEDGEQMKKEEKTNVMRILDARKIAYTGHTYAPDAALVWYSSLSQA